MGSVEEFVAKTKKLLEYEREAEIEQTRTVHENTPLKELEKVGVCILKLRIGSRRTGLYGRTVLTFEPYWPTNQMPAHSFTPGDITGVNVSNEDSCQQPIVSGTVSQIGQSYVSIAFDDSQDAALSVLDDDVQYRIVKLANDITYQRLKRTLNDLHGYISGCASTLLNVVFSGADIAPPMSHHEISFHNDSLNSSQKEAVRFALSQRDVSIIHGPPGTGKTTTVVEIIQQAVDSGLKVLACAPSNIAVDNLLERLATRRNNVVRLGHPARLLPSIQRYSLDAILSASDDTKIVTDVRKDIDRALTDMKKTRDKGQKQRLREDIKHLRKELRQREVTAIKRILQRADVVMATLTSANRDGPIRHLAGQHFDLVVIDEVSQAMEVACWIPLLQGSRCVLAGDHQQLPPTIISDRAAREGLAVTLMERLVERLGDQVVRMLTTQYRMNQVIMQWTSDQLYDGKLVADDSVKSHLLRDLPNINDNEDTATPLLLIDTAGCDLNELDTTDDQSKGNEGEADLVAAHVECLVSSGVNEKDIAVIAPYNMQVELIRIRLSHKYPKLEIKTVDGFQGREKEAVVTCLVRSNKKREIGFLAEDRRINVAVTRAKRHVAVICDSETVGRHTFLKSLVDYMMTHGTVRSAHQYQDCIHHEQSYSRPDNVKIKSMEKTSNKGGRAKTMSKKNHEINSGNSGMKLYPVSTDKTRCKQSGPVVLSNEEHIRETICEFVAIPHRKTLEFPSSFTSRDRFLVHEICESLGLDHSSIGDGQERHIIISKTQRTGLQTGSISQRETDCNNETKQNDSNFAGDKVAPRTLKGSVDLNHDNTEADTEATRSFPPSSVTCSNCGKCVLSENIHLHKLHCMKGNHPEKENIQMNVQKKKRQKDKTRTKPVPEEDFESLMAEAVKLNSVCNYTKCKTSVLTLGANCEFCAKRYCLGHHIPEAHGCGNAAKTKARQTIIREGVIYSGSGVPNKKPDANKRANLQRKIDQKLNDLSEKRKHKTK